jgi:hypothetical protein
MSQEHKRCLLKLVGYLRHIASPAVGTVKEGTGCSTYPPNIAPKKKPPGLSM